MTHKGVLLDTSFFLRFLNDADPLFKNADGYYRYFLDQGIGMMISTIAVAEYCVGGNVNELPLRNLQMIPFNLDHAKRAGEFGQIIFAARAALDIGQRRIIPNDIKLFAQADIEKSIDYYLSSDTESLKMYKHLKGNSDLHFNFIDLNIPYSQSFGVLEM